MLPCTTPTVNPVNQMGRRPGHLPRGIRRCPNLNRALLALLRRLFRLFGLCFFAGCLWAPFRISGRDFILATAEVINSSGSEKEAENELALPPLTKAVPAVLYLAFKGGHLRWEQMDFEVSVVQEASLELAAEGVTPGSLFLQFHVGELFCFYLVVCRCVLQSLSFAPGNQGPAD